MNGRGASLRGLHLARLAAERGEEIAGGVHRIAGYQEAPGMIAHRAGACAGCGA